MSRLLNETEAAAFEKILTNYEPNNEVLEVFLESNFGVIAGPAGAGKDTLRNGLISKYPGLYLPIVSTTTRPQRGGEIDGRDYHFREVKEVEEGLQHQKFFQAALIHSQQVSCLHVDEVNKLNNRQYGLSILVVKTEDELRAQKPDIKTLFVIPLNLQILLERINAERKLGKPEIARRLQAAKAEITFALQSPEYYCLVSDTIRHVTDAAHEFMQTDIRDKSEDARARTAMRKILKSLDN